MKRKISLFVALIMVVAMFAGCGSKTKTTTDDDQKSTVDTSKSSEEKDNEQEPEIKDQTLKVSVFQGGFGREYWDEVAKAFEAQNEGVTVEVVADPNIGERIRNDILSNDSPDFVFLSSRDKSGTTQSLIKDKAIADISDVMNKLKDKMIDGVLDNSLLSPYGDGKTYLAPFNFSSLGLWYNENYFKTNDITAPVTWDDFFELQNKITDRALITYAGIYPGYLESLVFPAIASGAGKDTFDKLVKYDVATLDSDEFKAIMEKFEKIASTKAIMNGTAGINHTTSQAEFLMGKAAMIPNGSWIANEMKDAPREDGFTWGFAAAPVLKADNDKYVVASMDEMYIPSASKNKELAKKFLEFLYSDEAIKIQAEKAQSVPPLKGVADVIKPFVDEATGASYTLFDKGYKPLISNFAAVDNMTLVPRKEFFGTVGQVITGTKTKEEAIDYLKPIFEEAAKNIVK
ncbi:carbohydrate ABC transporter substrate-binding protein [Vallitalea guaymasensis]|uniref:carbohydrate ABC transporter substrate-binding protein n=1 Tax=Vallitalea guaymasensis TaxID=1185412 RepID=UPI002355066F|nr:carbohydrate ABC transporter substrate-binding protein [Vallitalea guaymasensis]